MFKRHIQFSTISEIASLIRSKKLSSLKLTKLMLERIEKFNKKLNAFITVTSDLAIEQAQRADQELGSGHDRGPLHGIPIAIKDLIATKGIRTTAGSKYHENWIPDEDATVVKRFTDAGAVILGKTGLDELAWGTTSVNPFFGAISNPWKLDYHPGGSSGGSAAAVAAGLAYAALGTDTGCSVRQPAHCCGIVGHKPTFGLVSKSGVIPLVHSMDHVGPLTRSVRDAALVLHAIAGPDINDPYSVDRLVDNYLENLTFLNKGTVIGVPRRFFFAGGDPEVVRLVERALDAFNYLDGNLVDVDLPDVEAAFKAANVIFVETLDAHEKAWRENPGSFSDSLKKSFEAVSKWSAVEYAAAQNFRQKFRRQVTAVMNQCDVLVMPTSTVVAAPIKEEPQDHAKERWKNASIFNLTGQPSISVPCGFTQAGLPVGLMITGKMFEDAKVLQFAYAFEQATHWHQQHPPLF